MALSRRARPNGPPDGPGSRTIEKQRKGGVMHVTRSTSVALLFSALAASVGGAQETKPAAAAAPSAQQMEAAAAQFKSLGLLAYPAKGQSADKQKKDQAECYAWSKEQTGFDPATAAAVNKDSVAKAAEAQTAEA